MAADRKTARDPFAVALAEVLTGARLKAGASGTPMTQERLAELSGVSQTNISRTLNAQRETPARELLALCRALAIDPTAVLEEALRRSEADLTTSTSRSVPWTQPEASRLPAGE